MRARYSEMKRTIAVNTWRVNLSRRTKTLSSALRQLGVPRSRRPDRRVKAILRESRGKTSRRVDNASRRPLGGVESPRRRSSSRHACARSKAKGVPAGAPLGDIHPHSKGYGRVLFFHESPPSCKGRFTRAQTPSSL